MSNSKQDRQGARTPADLERKYRFGKTFGEMYEISTGAKREAEKASESVDELDKSLDQREIYMRLTDNEKIQGIFMENGDLYINAKYISNVDELFAKNITMTGKFTTTAEVFLEPGDPELEAMRKHVTQTELLPNALLYDFNNDGVVDAIDIAIVRKAITGEYDLSTWSGAKKSAVSITIDISNPQKAIRITGINMWGREIDHYFGANTVFMDENVAKTFDEFLQESSVIASIKQGGTGGSTKAEALANITGLHEDVDHHECYYHEILDSDGSNIREWQNPPMTIGTEYRTTERWNGKVVYTRIVDFGTLPNATVKTVATGLSGVSVVSLEGFVINASGTRYTFPYVNSSGVCAYNYISTDGTLGVRTFADASACTAYFVLKYTKD